MTPERSATSDRVRLSVGFEATPLLGHPTGVGAFCRGALTGLTGLPALDVSAFAVTWRRRRQLEELVPPGISVRQRAMPARPLHTAWSRYSQPPVEWFLGPRDVVHGTNFVVPPTRKAARVVTVHDLTVVLYPELCDPPTLRFPELIRRAVADGAWVHTPSQFIADQVVEVFSIPPERVRSVHHGVPVPLAPAHPPASGTPDPSGTRDTPSTPGPSGTRGTPSTPDPFGTPGTPDPPPLRLPEGCDRYVLAIGTIEPRKDYPLLVSAFDALAADHPGVALVVVGADGWGAGRFAAAVEASPWRTRILRPGYLDEPSLDAVLRHASVLAYPSRYEGFGFPPLQAMAVGVPVVATAAGAVPEVVGDGGVLVAPGDRDGLAAALSRVLDRGTDVEELVGRGRRRSAGFTWEACAAGLADLYTDAHRDRISTGAGR